MENGGNIYNINNNPFRNANTSHASSYHFFKHPAATIQGCGNTTTTTAAAITISTRFSETQHVDGGGCESLERVNGRCLTKKRRVCSGGGEGGRGTVVVVGQSASSAAAAPAELRCQVDGCHVELRRAKVYHKKHKVCEVHSKAQSVVMFGIDQRFCQQCSRFHAVSEFDESKRSCRRRLACHNQRRRKSSKDLHGNTKMQLPPNVCAHSLLSSNTTFWNSETADLSTQCSAALRELIAENRATVLAHQQHMLEKVIFSIHQREG